MYLIHTLILITLLPTLKLLFHFFHIIIIIYLQIIKLKYKQYTKN